MMGRRWDRFWWRHGSDWLEGIIFVIIMASLILAVIVPLVAGLHFADKKICEAKANKMGIESDFAFWQGCMWKIDGEWVPRETYRVVEDQRDDDSTTYVNNRQQSTDNSSQSAWGVNIDSKFDGMKTYNYSEDGQ